MTSHETLNVIVRDQDGVKLAELADWDATTLLGCVSSDPRSVHELRLAWLRYRSGDDFDNLPWRDCETIPNESGTRDWLLIDLARLRLESNCEDVIPAKPGGYQRERGRWTNKNPVVFMNFPPSWQRVISSGNSPTLQQLLTPSEPVHFRGVLFGRAMAIDFAKRMSKFATDEELPEAFHCWDDLPRGLDADDPRRAAATRWHSLTVRVHGSWLMTPRDDLGGAMPRLFLHRGREWVEAESENRIQQWSTLKVAPRALDRDTFTYTHGPMGLTEVVVYYELCREVLKAGWRRLCEAPDLADAPDLLASTLYDHSRHWLSHGRIDDDSTPPADIIEVSRRHMPQLADGTHLDCECEVCQMMANDRDLFYPGFLSFDGHQLELDGEFAFSLWPTREEWEELSEVY